MSSKSNDQGRAFEYAFITSLEREIAKCRPVSIVMNKSYEAAQKAWAKIGNDLKAKLTVRSLVAIPTLFELEPRMIEKANDCLSLSIQKDSEGMQGDVRDILVERSNIQWVVGLSLKHNHFAVKHSRLSKSLDFGEKWFGVPCSDSYWAAVEPVFRYLDEQEKRKTKWSDLPAKEEDVYIPLLEAFINEIELAQTKDSSVPKRIAEYLLGYYDFYKVIGIDSRDISQIQTYNLYGTLNSASKTKAPNVTIPRVKLPTQIVNLGLKSKSSNTVELTMNNGWQFSFRIHNASSIVESSLKFDVQAIEVPVTIITLDCA